MGTFFSALLNYLFYHKPTSNFVIRKRKEILIFMFKSRPSHLQILKSPKEWQGPRCEDPGLPVVSKTTHL